MAMTAQRRGCVSVATVIAFLATVAVAMPAQARAAIATPNTGEPGEVVTAAPAVYTVDPLLHTPMPRVRATRVVYRSSTAAGEPDTVSGTVLVPTTPYPGRRPVVGYAVGTHGLGDDCAPSHQMSQGTETETLQISGLLAAGWAVAVTDYEGLGTPGQHTYMVGPSMGHAVLDVVRAATRLPGTGLSIDGPVAVWGYSQGGAAAGWAAQLQPSYAPELRLAGAAVGGVPADIAAVARHLDGGAFFGLAVAAVIGLDAAFPDLRLPDNLSGLGRMLLTAHRNDCLAGLIPAFALRSFAQLTTTDLLARPDWQAAFARSLLGGTPPRVPILMQHGLFDEVIPYSIGNDLRHQYCAEGVTVDFRTYPLADHVLGALVTAPDAITWLTARFTGTPATTNC
jgi:cephalosporin-C deacetylase-like acetyl esterase